MITKNGKETVCVSVLLSPDDYQTLKARAKLSQRSMGAYLRCLLQENFNEENMDKALVVVESHS